MDHKLPDDFFEEFLKEATSNFIMTPSRRVWNSIYNNLHPSRRYPSFGTSMLICGLVFLIGFLDSEIIDKNAHITGINLTHNHTIAAFSNNNHTLLPDRNSVKQSKRPVTVSTARHPEIASVKSKRNLFDAHSRKKTTQIAPSAETFINETEVSELPEASNTFIKQNFIKEADNLLSSTIKNKRDFNISTEILNPMKQNNSDNFSFQFYATPSYGYRQMNRNTDPIKPSSLVVNAAAVNESFTFRHSPALNLEAGGTLMMPINADFRVKAGMQFNYTNYKILADRSSNVFLTQLQVSEPGNYTLLESHLTSLSNVSNINPAGSFFNSNTFQVSLPIGTDFRLMGNNNLQWFAGATIQPSYLINSSPFMISADMKNYITDDDFVRRWNMNTSVETFVSYRLKNGAMFNAGPQLRYQLFSTYDKRYSFNEKLYSIGIKVGITRNF